MKKQTFGVRSRAFISMYSSFRKNRKAARLAVALLLCMLLTLYLSGCWSRRELGTLGIVLGTALDVGTLPDTLELTAQVVKTREIKTGSSGSKEGATAEKAYANIQNTDKSVLSLLRGITHLSNRKLYFPHNQVLIFSSDLAKQDIAEGLDAFMRDYEARMNVYILVSKGKAAEILDEEFDLEKIPAMHISKMLENQKTNSETVIVTLRDFAIATLSTSRAPVAPMIELYESNGKKQAKLEGTAVFKQGKMIGELDKTQTRGLLWVTGEAKNAVMTVDTQWGQVVLEIVHSKSSLKPVKTKDGLIRMELKISEEGDIESNETAEDMSRLENVELLKELAREVIRFDVESALKQARSLSADVFGFGEKIHSEYPEEWEKMKDNWDLVFSGIELDIQVDVKLRGTGSLIKPVVPGGAS